MTKLNGMTPDIAAENIEQIKTLFPDVFCEGKIDLDKLKQVLGEYIEMDHERYNFTWNGKGKALRLAQTPSTGTLRPCKEESKNWDITQNLYIEGDNLEVLKLLQKTYHNKIKMIYIDPPYNTGKDFVYPDDYKDSLENYLRITGQKDEDGSRLSTNSEASGRYHTNWLNMMYPRLRLARNLLRDDGIIFISIDDNEINNLKRICSEIFGEENFVSQIVVQLNPRGRQSDTFMATVHEYVLCFAKNSASCRLFGMPLTEEQKLDYSFTDEIGGAYRLLGLRQRGSASRREDRPDMYFPVYVDLDTEAVSLDPTSNSVAVYPKKSDDSDGRWMWGKEKCNNENYRLVARLIKQRNEYDIFVKDYLNRDDSERTRKFKTIWDDKKINNQTGTQEVKRLIDGDWMSFPKSHELMKYICTLGCGSDGLILDFFSGSATTAHAVMELNANDGGHRRYIMVQLPEPIEIDESPYKNICEIGKERIRRAGEKIKAELADKQSAQISMMDDVQTIDPESLDIGFKVFKLDSTNLKKWNPDYDNLEASLEGMVSNYVEGRTELDVVCEIMLKYGIDLTFSFEEYDFSGKKVYSIGFGALVICLDNDITTSLAQDIVKLKKELSPETMRVVFKDNGFANDAAKTNVKENLRQAGIDEFVTV